MGILTEDMKRIVREQKLGFFATVCPDGSPNLSPKGTTIVWDDQHLAFLDLASPGTLANLRGNSNIEICMVDPFVRKGYRFKGNASIVTEGLVFEDILKAYHGTVVEPLLGSVRSAVLVQVERTLSLISPGYLPGITEQQMRNQYEQYWDALTELYHGRPAKGS